MSAARARGASVALSSPSRYPCPVGVAHSDVDDGAIGRHRRRAVHGGSIDCRIVGGRAGRDQVPAPLAAMRANPLLTLAALGWRGEEAELRIARRIQVIGVLMMMAASSSAWSAV